MRDEDDTPPSEEDRYGARLGESLIAAAVADTWAPQSLRESIERHRDEAGRAKAPFWRAHRRRLAVVAGAGLAATVAVVAALQLGGDGSSGPSLAEVDGASRARPTSPAPDSVGGTPPVLDAKVGALVFPDWEKKFRWQATGARTDDLSSRTVKTVFYRNPKGARLGYSVVGGDALGQRPPGRAVRRNGHVYRVDSRHGRTVVTWRQQGHTCVIVAQGPVPESRLVDLAASRNT